MPFIRTWHVAAASGAVALLTMIAVSRAAGATLSAQLGRGLTAGAAFAFAVYAAVKIVRWLGDASEAVTGDAHVDGHEADTGAEEGEAAALAAAAAVQSEPFVTTPDIAAAAPSAAGPTDAGAAADEFAPLVVPRLSAAEIDAAAGGQPQAVVSDD